MGGSTNTVLHLLAAAQEAGVDFKMSDIDRMSRKVPNLCKVAPATQQYHMEDVHRAGGVIGILAELDRGGLIHRDCKAVHSASMGEAIDRWDVIRGKEDPEGDLKIGRVLTLVVLLVVIAGIVWLCIELIRGMTRLLQPPASALLDRVLDWSRNHPRIKPLAGSLLDPDHPEARGLATLAVLLFFTLWGLLLILRQELHGRFMASIDVYLFHALQGLRTP